MSFRATADTSMGMSTGDADYTEIAYSAAYSNFIVGSVEDRTGQNQMYVGGSRAALLEAVVDPIVHSLQFNISGVGISASGPTKVQIVGSGASIPGAVILPDGRDVLMNIDSILIRTKSFAPFNVAIDALGNGSTSTLSTPAGFHGATVLFGGVEILGGGMFGTLIEPIAVTL